MSPLTTTTPKGSSMSVRRSTVLARLSLIAVVGGVVLTGCSAPATATVPSPSASAPAEKGIAISDAWVKSAAEGMSAVFGRLTNNSGSDITVVSATSKASSMIELHETVQNDAGEMIMRPIQGGFVVPAGGARELAPGGDHIMLMGLTGPLKAGEEVSFTLTLSDGSEFVFSAPVKDYSGANEKYDGGSTPEPSH